MIKLVSSLLILVVMASVSLAVASQESGSGSKTVLDGVYTEAQARRGEDQYFDNCSRCHRDDLRGSAEAPALIGPRFIDSWREDGLSSLFNHISTRMPRAPLPKLTQPVYLDIVSFILRSNGYPAGDKELTVDVVAKTRFVGKDGPKPIPNLSVVLVVGCLATGGNNNWTLSNATEPVRNRTPGETNPDELKTSGALPLGTQNFRLQNFEYVRPDFSPEPYKGQKVQVKGTLVLQANNSSRINVTSLEALAPSCAE
jgi:mono/diheme cytochrome c family protein